MADKKIDRKYWNDLINSIESNQAKKKDHTYENKIRLLYETDLKLQGEKKKKFFDSLANDLLQDETDCKKEFNNTIVENSINELHVLINTTTMDLAQVINKKMRERVDILDQEIQKLRKENEELKKNQGLNVQIITHEEKKESLDERARLAPGLLDTDEIIQEIKDLEASGANFLNIKLAKVLAIQLEILQEEKNRKEEVVPKGCKVDDSYYNKKAQRLKGADLDITFGDIIGEKWI